LPKAESVDQLKEKLISSNKKRKEAEMTKSSQVNNSNFIVGNKKQKVSK